MPPQRHHRIPQTLRGRAKTQSKMSTTASGSPSPPRRSRKPEQRRIPRRSETSHHSPTYNRIIRLEGQISCIISILKFHLRYAPFPTDTSLSALRIHPLAMYFDAINELSSHIECGLDFNGAFNAGDLIFLANEQYFPLLDSEEAEHQPHWPKILWLAQLQRILEDETLRLPESLKRGWEWFMDLTSFPAQYGNMGEWAMGWHELAPTKQKEFLTLFDVNAEVLNATMSQVQSTSLCGPQTLQTEQSGCLQTFLAQDRPLDAITPLMLNPSRQNLGLCPLCATALRKENIGSLAKLHRAVEIPCGHVFGSSCIVRYFRKPGVWACPECGKNLFDAPHHPVSASDVLASCDRILRFMEPPAAIALPPSPNSYLEKLGIVFEDADEIRVRFSYWVNAPYGMDVELVGLLDLALYLARERLDAVVKGDVIEWRDVVGRQVQVEARIQWVEFLRGCHVNSPVVW